jgi:hypothetical protein
VQDENWDVFTRQGSHINRKGKELLATKIASVIKDLLNKKNLIR